MNAGRVLAAAGWTGAALTALILAMSVLLRLGTDLQGGAAVSVLAPGLEQGARIAHRVAAMGVGIGAALVLVLVLQGGEARRGLRAPAGAVVLLTLVLAIVGRYSVGYRHDLVTVVNVAAGIALAAGFLHLALAVRERHGGEPLARVALLLLLALAATGAGADAAAMRGIRAYGPLHLGLGTIFAVLALAAAWRQRRRAVVAATAALLTLAQASLGLYLIPLTLERPILPAWAHALLAVALSLVLVRLWAGPAGPRPRFASQALG